MLDPNIYDQSWFTGEPCAAPCWYGLEPGVSSREGSISKTEQLPFIDGATASFSDPTVFPYYDAVVFRYKNFQDANSVGLYFEGGILNKIMFPPGYRVTFEQAVEKLGNPDGYDIGLSPGGLFTGCRLFVIWENKRLMLEYDTGEISIISFGPNRDLCNNFGKQPLPRGLLVDLVYIMSPSFTESVIKSDFYPWNGFAK